MRHADRLGAAHAVILDDRRARAAPRHELRRAAGDRRSRRWSRSSPGGERAGVPASRRCGRTTTATPGAARCSTTGSASTVRVAGWVHRRRDHGGLVFIDLRDRTGIVQLVFNPDTAGGAFELGHRLRAEDVSASPARSCARSPETVNPELPTGEFEIRVAEATLLADAETPPFEIESFSGEVGEEMRLRYRYLDLRRERMREAIELRHEVTQAMREFIDGEGFLEIETPMLTRSTPEGARDFLVPSRLQPGSFYALPQSPQLFKQLLMIAGFERYYQIARCFRDEDLRADRQLDFTQLDVEMSFVGVEDVLDLNERLLAHVLGRVRGRGASCRSRGSRTTRRWRATGPTGRTLRFGLELRDLTDCVRETEFKVFRGAIEGGGVVRGLNAGRRELSRAELDGLIAEATGARGEGARVGVRRGRGLALAGRQVPLAGGDRGDQPARSALRRATCCSWSPIGPRPRRSVLGALRRDLAERFEPDRRRAACVRVGSSTGRCSSGTRPRGAGTRSTTRSPRRRASSTRPIPGRRGRCAYDVVWNGQSSWAAARSASTDPERPARGLRGARHRPAGGRGAFRLPARGAALRGAAARRESPTASTAWCRAASARNRSAT